MMRTGLVTRCLLIPALLLAAGNSAAVAAPSPEFDIKGGVLSVRIDDKALPVSLKSPTFALGDTIVGGASPTTTAGSLSDGATLEAVFSPIPIGDGGSLETRLLVRWSQDERVLRKWARFRVIGSPKAFLLKEVVLDRIDAGSRAVWTHGLQPQGKEGPVILEGPQSHPVFLPGLFLGVEFPVSSTRLENGQVVLAHRPGLKVQPGTWHETRAAVFGVTSVGDEVQSFQRYVTLHRPKPRGFHVNYNSWWTSPVPYTEGDIAGLMKQFEDRLFKAHGVSFDTFCIDMGWSNAKSVWEIDPKLFPSGFTNIRKSAEDMRANLGLWVSPSSCYPQALDGPWAKDHGFETTPMPGQAEKNPSYRILCLGGKQYAGRFKDRLADLAGRYHIQHFKFDGCVLECPETNHGHEPGPLSSEAIAEGVIAAAEAARKANPDVWIETTCFGYNPSPWWLFHVNSVIGTFGDDAPVGRVPSPLYRESYTSARDYFNLQGAYLLPIPAGAQEVLGVVHQSPDDLLNDAVVTVLRGHMFLPLYVNPKFMNDARWRALADLLKWARKNAPDLAVTTPILPASWQGGKLPRFSDQGIMPRQAYGYAHVKEDSGLIALRNPWIAPQPYVLKLDKTLGFSASASELSAVSLYPETRLYGEGLKFGGTLTVDLAPYETIVLSVKKHPSTKDLPRPVGSESSVRVVQCNPRMERVEFQGPAASLGPDWTCRLGASTSAARLALDAQVQVTATQAELLVLCEGDKPLTVPIGTLKINGRETELVASSSATGWSATLLPTHEHWVFLRVPLAAGENGISLEQFLGTDCTKVSAWLWAKKSGGTSDYPNALPQPETISLGGASLLAETELSKLPPLAIRVDRPVDRIDGIYLDALEPVSVRQGWGTLQKNRSVWEKPMILGGKQFPRGLGTHAPSRIVYALDGNYRRFQSWAGADANTGPSVTFEVRVDGAVKWQSGIVTRDSAPARIDLDVSGAKTLELIVGDAGNLAGDHADWAEARLLR